MDRPARGYLGIHVQYLWERVFSGGELSRSREAPLPRFARRGEKEEENQSQHHCCCWKERAPQMPERSGEQKALGYRSLRVKTKAT